MSNPNEEAKHGAFQKLPVTIQAFRYDEPSDAFELGEWAGVHGAFRWDANNALHIKTLEGEHIASPGDWIIRGVKGEFYPCKPDVFAQTYKPTPSAEGVISPEKTISDLPGDFWGWSLEMQRGWLWKKVVALQSPSTQDAEEWYRDRMDCGPDVGTVPQMLADYTASLRTQLEQAQKAKDYLIKLEKDAGGPELLATASCRAETAESQLKQMAEALTSVDPFSGGRDGDECLWCRRDKPRDLHEWSDHFNPEHHNADCEVVKLDLAKHYREGQQNG